MARGEDSRNHPNRKVGRVNFYGLRNDGFIAVDWEGGDHEAVPFNELRHANTDVASPFYSNYGKRVSKKDLKETADRRNSSNRFSSADIHVMRDGE